MKKVFMVILMIFLVVGLTYGQGKTDNKWHTRNIGFVFFFSGFDNLNLNEYWGGAGAKICFGPFAFRPALIYGNLTFDDNMLATPTWVGEHNSMTTMGFGADFLVRISPPGRLEGYLGIGVGYRSGKSTEDDEYDTAVIGGPDITEMTTSSLGFSLVWGVEFFLAQNFSLGGEMRFGYASTSWEDTYTAYGMPAVITTDETMKMMGFTTTGAIIAVFYIK